MMLFLKYFFPFFNSSLFDNEYLEFICITNVCFSYNSFQIFNFWIEFFLEAGLPMESITGSRFPVCVVICSDCLFSLHVIHATVCDSNT